MCVSPMIVGMVASVSTVTGRAVTGVAPICITGTTAISIVALLIAIGLLLISILLLIPIGLLISVTLLLGVGIIFIGGIILVGL